MALRERGVRTAVLLRWSPASWSGGVRAGGGHRLPVDLREAFERGRRLGGAYGDLVDVWEVDNEPDIAFLPDNPEVYAAFLKAVYLGIHAGVSEAPAVWRAPALNLQADGSGWRERKRGGVVSAGAVPWREARVIMAPLALPPGPYLERLWINGVASYTDGFNFHYYGYAEDFTGVYRQFEAAVSELCERPTSNVEHSTSNVGGSERERARDLHRSGRGDAAVPSGREPSLVTSAATSGREQHGRSKRLPVFITEYGYGLLDAEARSTVEGRVRQWRWFDSVVRQVRALRPEGPMAFLWTPYYEAGLNEFGLMMKTVPRVAESWDAQGSGGEAVFSTGDFGAKQAEPWMRQIGKKVEADFASPALAQLWDYAANHPYRPRDWRVTAAAASPVVIDVIAGADMGQVKVSGAYRLQGRATAGLRTGRARVVIYNLSAAEVRGQLEWAESGPVISGRVGDLVLAPGERREIAVELGVSSEVWTETVLGMRFIPKGGGAESVWKAGLLPSSEGRWLVPVASFGMGDNGELLARQAARVGASEEPKLYRQGRWLASEGVRVEEVADRAGVWRFHIDYLSEAPLRPAAVELPLSAGVVFEPDRLLTFDYRQGEVSGAVRAPESGADGRAFDPRRLKPLAGVHGNGLSVFVRTANGNLFQVSGRVSPGSEWRSSATRVQDFTMWFFGRAELPWRFAENTPVSLFFFLRPAKVPAVFELRDAQLVRVE